VEERRSGDQEVWEGGKAVQDVVAFQHAAAHLPKLLIS